MLKFEILWKPAMCQIFRNRKLSCGCSTLLTAVLILAGIFPSSTALELCGGIKNRFVCDDQDPTVFHICLGNNQYTMTCPGTLHFNVRTQNCDWPDSVNCVQEAMTRQSSGTSTPKSTPSTVSTKTDHLTASQRDSSIHKTRPTRPSSVSSSPGTSTLNSTRHSLKETIVPAQETSNAETSISRYRLKAVPGINKPLESLLPADEKVIEEVKKLSEELKHIDNYLQSVESDQVGFMIEPYMAKFPRRKHSFSNRYMQTLSRKELVPSFSPYRRRWMSQTTKYHHHDNNITPKALSKVVSSEFKSSSPYKPTSVLYHSEHPSTPYRWHNAPTATPRNTNTFPNSQNDDDNSVINRSDNVKVNEVRDPSTLNVSPSEVRTSKSEKINPPNQSTNSLLVPYSSSWNRHSEGSRKSHTAGRLDYTKSSSNIEHPNKYTTDSRTTQLSSRRFQENVSSRLRHNESRSSSRLPSSSTVWWSKTKPSYYSTSPISHKSTRLTGTIATRKYTNGPQKSYTESAFTSPVVTVRPSSSQWWLSSKSDNKLQKPFTENMLTSSTVTVRPQSSLWWSPSKSNNKFTATPNTSRRPNRQKYKPRQYIPKPNYNTRTPNSNFALVPTNQKSTSYMSLDRQNEKNDRLINAPAALERDFALHSSVVIPAAKERDFALHNVNAAASADRIVLHNPYANARAYNEGVSKMDSIFALHKTNEDLKTNVISAYRSPIDKYETKKGKCSSSWCKLPDCRCIGSDIPGEYDAKDVPQMVLLTFDDSINSQNMHYFRGFFNRTLKNPNGCTIKSTFFVSGDNSDYEMVRSIYKQGHEIASHTLSHRNPTTWWATAGFENWEMEIAGMRDKLHEKSGIPFKEITGMRAPFLQVGGDGQYAMLKENKFRYDSSMVTGNLYSNSQPPIWPFTLDTPPDGTTCSLTPCPTRSYPGLWEVPLIRWYGSNKIACAMPDACTIDLGTKGTRKFIDENFNRHYRTNRAPFGIFIHASWFSRKDGNFQGLYEFLASLAEKEDVWVVTVNQALDWIQHPIKLSELNALKSWQC